MILKNIYVDEIVKSLKNFKNKERYLLHEPTLDKNDLLQLKKCITSTYVSTVSSHINIFEKRLSNFTKSKYVIATLTGTAAIEIALKSVGINKNEEVLIPNINYIATSNSLLQIGAIPHFVDINLDDLGVDIEKLDLYLKKNSYFKNNKLINKKTKRIISAIMPTYIFGNSCDVDQLVKLTKKFKLKLIEDSSESLGSFYKKKHLGTFGEAGVISFNGNKIITTGAGGAILTNSKKIFNRAIHLTKIARKQNFFWEYDYDEPGHNYRMPGLNPSLGISQIKKLNLLLKKKEKIYNVYKKYFADSSKIRLVKETKNSKWNYWLNTIFINNSNLQLRNKVIIELNKKRIFVRPIWKPMSKISYLKKFPKMDLKNSSIAEKSLISLPSSPNLNEKK